MKGKRLLTLIGSVCLALMLAALLIPGCVPKAEAPEELPTIHWKCQDPYGGLPEMYGFVRAPGRLIQVCDEVREKTNGKFDIEIYVPGALFSTAEFYEALKTGAIDMVLMQVAHVGGSIPVADGADRYTLSGLTAKTWYEEIYSNPDYMDILQKSFAEHGLKFGGTFCGTAQCLHTKFPVHTIADLQGKKIWGYGVQGKVLENLGAVPIYMQSGEIYSALQRGMLDGILWGTLTVLAKKWYEQLDYTIRPSFMNPIVSGWHACLASWNALPREYQDILQAASDRATYQEFVEVPNGSDYYAWEIEQTEEYGMEVITLSDEVFREMREAALPTWDEYAARGEDCAKVIELVKRAVGLE